VCCPHLLVTPEKGPVPKKSSLIEWLRFFRTSKRKQAKRSALFAPSPRPEGESGHATRTLQTRLQGELDEKDKIQKYSFFNYSLTTKLKMRGIVKKNDQLKQRLEQQQLSPLLRGAGRNGPAARTGGNLLQQAV